ncbi:MULTISPECIES: hypothetical protein [unclassified Rhizobium]|uniref:hypothetical protein n=1 Tax=unclassified Rhizobium TaxID=2613769 RepID=UPI00380F153E
MQFDVRKNAEDPVAAGRLRVAIQKRVSERELDGWRVSAKDLKTAGDMATALILAVVLICLALASQVASFPPPMAITVSAPNHNQAVRSSNHG